MKRKEWDKHEPGSLMKRTIELLKDTTQTHLTIYDATGIKPDWLGRFLSGAINDPGVNRIQKLYEYLSGAKLGIK